MSTSMPEEPFSEKRREEQVFEISSDRGQGRG